MKFSALTSSLPTTTGEAIETIADLGFAWIDPPPFLEANELAVLRERQLQVSCVGLEKGEPAGLDLSSSDDALRRRSVDYYCRTVAATAALDAPIGYLTPPATSEPESVKRWTDSLTTIGEAAAREEIRLAVEHFPGRALPTVAATLEFLETLGLPSLALLIDVGHCLISREDPAESIAAAGSWLAYIHFDDNDGKSDLHWPLLQGVLSEAQLADVLSAQASVGYAGGLCLELNPALPNPADNLGRGLALLRRLAPS